MRNSGSQATTDYHNGSTTISSFLQGGCREFIHYYIAMHLTGCSSSNNICGTTQQVAPALTIAEAVRGSSSHHSSNSSANSCRNCSSLLQLVTFSCFLFDLSKQRDNQTKYQDNLTLETTDNSNTVTFLIKKKKEQKKKERERERSNVNCTHVQFRIHEFTLRLFLPLS